MLGVGTQHLGVAISSSVTLTPLLAEHRTTQGKPADTPTYLYRLRCVGKWLSFCALHLFRL
jgi:hypothetical protein